MSTAAHPERSKGNIMDASNFYSALLGAILGISSSFLMYWYTQYSSAKRKFTDYLLFLKYDVHWECEDRPERVHDYWNKSLKDVWALYNSVYDNTPFWKRKQLQKAWYEYKGVDPEILKVAADSKFHPRGKQDFIEKIKALIEIV
jgi:hypothetical protein